MSQLRELAEPFKDRFVKPPPKGKHGEYVSHSTVNERALSVVGAHSFEITQLIRNQAGQVVGVLGRLEAEIDGRKVVVTEVGDEEHPDNGTDGANAKNAASDAYKRCWMRLGLGLHLWSQEDYFLAKQLDKQGGRHMGDAKQYEMRDAAGNVVKVLDADGNVVKEQTQIEYGPGEEPFE